MNPKTRNKILKTITTLSVILFFIGVGSLDGENVVIPIIMCSVSGLWIFIFLLANGE